MSDTLKAEKWVVMMDEILVALKEDELDVLLVELLDNELADQSVVMMAYIEAEWKVPY